MPKARPGPTGPGLPLSLRSRYWPYTVEDLSDIAVGYETHGLPLDILVSGAGAALAIAIASTGSGIDTHTMPLWAIGNLVYGVV